MLFKRPLFWYQWKLFSPEHSSLAPKLHFKGIFLHWGKISWNHHILWKMPPLWLILLPLDWIFPHYLFFPIISGSSHVNNHRLKTPNEGINQRNLKFWADVTNKICFSRTKKFGIGIWFSAMQWRRFSHWVSVVRVSNQSWILNLPFLYKIFFVLFLFEVKVG